MKSNTPIAFAFENTAIRIAPNNGDPLFIAADVCRALGLENPTRAIAELDNDEKGKIDRHSFRFSNFDANDTQNDPHDLTLTSSKGQKSTNSPDADNGQANASQRGGAQYFNVITESGLYALVFKSRKPEAKRFRKWVTSEVLPSIRKSGGYGVLSPSDEIRYMNQRLALLRELRHERDPLLREKIYEQFRTVSDRLGYETPALDAFAAPHPHDALDAATRRVLDTFWQAITALQNLAIPVNHHRDSRYFAINLKEIITLCEDNGIALPGRIELKRALPMSRAPAFIAANHPVKSARLDKTVRCYVFAHEVSP